MQLAGSWSALFCSRSATMLPIRALRQVVVGRDYKLAARDFESTFGDRAGEAFTVFQAFVILLGRAARRPLQVGYPGYCGMTPDERVLLQIIAAAQAGEDARLDAHLCWLARKDRRPELAETARTFSAMLAGRVAIPAPAGGTDHASADDPLFESACVP